MTASQFWVSADPSEDDHWFLGTLATVKAAGARTGGQVSVVEFLHPPGFATPRHVHHRADEAFYVLSGSIHGFCGDRPWEAGEGALVWLPRDIPHGYRVDDGVSVRTLAITLPAGFDQFVTEVATPALQHELPPLGQAPDMARLLAAAERDGMEILGPPPTEPMR